MQVLTLRFPEVFHAIPAWVVGLVYRYINENWSRDDAINLRDTLRHTSSNYQPNTYFPFEDGDKYFKEKVNHANPLFLAVPNSDKFGFQTSSERSVDIPPLNHQCQWNLVKTSTTYSPDKYLYTHFNQKMNHVNSSLRAVPNSDELRLQTSSGRSFSNYALAAVIGLAAVRGTIHYGAKFFPYLLSLANTAVGVIAGAIAGCDIGAYTGGAAGCIYGASAGRVGGVVYLFVGGVTGAAVGAVTGALVGAVTGSVARRVCSYFGTSPATTTAVTTIASGVGGGSAGAGVVAGVAIAAVNKVATGSATPAAVAAACSNPWTAFAAVVAAIVAGGFWYWRNRQG